MRKAAYQCKCRDCQDELVGAIAQEHGLLNQVVMMLNEKQRRQFAGLLARQLGHGGIQRMAQITGLHRITISRGRSELEENQKDDGRIRCKGGGRSRIEKKIPRFSQC